MRLSLRFLSVFLSAAAIVPAVHADILTDIQSDLDAWQVESDQGASDDVQRQTDEAFANDKMLFPVPVAHSSSSAGILEELRNQRTEDVLSVTVNGVNLIFGDVPKNAWFAPYIRAIAELGIVSGYRDEAGSPTGLFGPGDNVTVEQMAKVMVATISISPTDCPSATLNATASGSWSASYMACAEQRSWSVYADGSVDAHRNATRAEVVATLLQAFDMTTDAETGTGAMAFTDVGPAMQYGTAVEKAKEDGIVSGYTDANGDSNGLFGPNDPVTRAEFAKIVNLGMQVYGRK